MAWAWHVRDADVYYGGAADVFDNVEVVKRIGQNPCAADPIYDTEGDCDVDAADLAELLADWGSCPL